MMASWSFVPGLAWSVDCGPVIVLAVDHLVEHLALDDGGDYGGAVVRVGRRTGGIVNFPLNLGGGRLTLLLAVR